MPDESNVATAADKAQPKDIYALLAAVDGAPDKAKVEAWKQTTCNGRIKLVTPDMRRFFFMRGVNGLEMAKLEAMVPEGSTNPQADLQYKIVAAACLWTNATPKHVLEELDLRAQGAGLVETLFQAVMELSDYMQPAEYMRMSVEL